MILDALECHGRARVSVDGMDVTNYGFWCDTKAGIVKAYEWEGYPAPPAPGTKIIKPRRIVEIRGKVHAEIQIKDGQ